jgi:hypothetical protein
MTFALIGVALVAAFIVGMAARGNLAVSFPEPIAKQAVNQARRRQRISREAAWILDDERKKPPAPLFGEAGPPPDPADDDVPPIPLWQPMDGPPAP